MDILKKTRRSSATHKLKVKTNRDLRHPQELYSQLRVTACDIQQVRVSIVGSQGRKKLDFQACVLSLLVSARLITNSLTE